jgi:hypothetical protein
VLPIGWTTVSDTGAELYGTFSLQSTLSGGTMTFTASGPQGTEFGSSPTDSFGSTAYLESGAGIPTPSCTPAPAACREPELIMGGAWKGANANLTLLLPGTVTALVKLGGGWTGTGSEAVVGDLACQETVENGDGLTWTAGGNGASATFSLGTPNTFGADGIKFVPGISAAC